MKIAIISDIHDNLINLKKCLNWCEENNIEELICCGDVTNSETLEFLSRNFTGKVHLVKGNMEIYGEKEVERYGNIKYYGRVGRAEINGKNVGICHEPFLIKKILEQGECDIIFYGHTHAPWTEKQDSITTVNPGTLGAVFQKATFAAWDSESGALELKVLEII
ncbi:MAG: YfcE family phosphodiesterase [bacterium]|nr:YfcE family phosphodiesterase [bacterium]